MPQISNKIKLLICCLLVLIVSYFTYFDNYYKTNLPIYSEYYYIIDAERYIHRIVSFGTHPPLGKMFIALGEKIFNPNEHLDIKNRLQKEAVFSNAITGFSFIGVRFFPSLFALLNGLLIFLLFYRVSKNNFLSLMFSSLYLFENSSIVHFRSAMLDSTLVFFSLLTILYFMYLYEKKTDGRFINYFIFGGLTGFAVTTKTVGLIFLLLFGFLLMKDLKFKRVFKLSLHYFFGLILVILLVYYVHVILGKTIIKHPLFIDANTQVLENDVNGNFGLGASKKYMQMVDNNEIYNPLKFYIPMTDYLRHMMRVQSLLPVEDPHNNNSDPVSWPIGVKNINYIYFNDVSMDNMFSYLTLQGNPINWALGLFAILFSIGLIIVKNISKGKASNTRTYNYIFIFITLYIAYMGAVMLVAVQRVVYINSYFLPLFFSFILFFLVFNYIFEKYIIKKDILLYVSVFLLVSQIFYAYYCTLPITYAKPITYYECEKTRIIDFWEDFCQR